MQNSYDYRDHDFRKPRNRNFGETDAYRNDAYSKPRNATMLTLNQQDLRKWSQSTKEEFGERSWRAFLAGAYEIMKVDVYIQTIYWPHVQPNYWKCHGPFRAQPNYLPNYLTVQARLASSKGPPRTQAQD